MISPLFVAVVLILLFWYLTKYHEPLPVCMKKCNKESLGEPTDMVFDDSSTSRAVNIMSGDSAAVRANSTGLKTTGQFVNSAFETPADDPTFN